MYFYLIASVAAPGGLPFRFRTLEQIEAARDTVSSAEASAL